MDTETVPEEISRLRLELDHVSEQCRVAHQMALRMLKATTPQL